MIEIETTQMEILPIVLCRVIDSELEALVFIEVMRWLVLQEGNSRRGKKRKWGLIFQWCFKSCFLFSSSNPSICQCSRPKKTFENECRRV